MINLRQTALWYLMITKSLLRKAAYWFILLLIPILTLGMAATARADSGILHIILCQNAPDDQLAATIQDRLLKQDTIIRYTQADSEEEALRAVVTGQADAAWIFEEDFTRRFDTQQAPIRILTREDQPLLILAREQLYGAMAPDNTLRTYRNYLYDLLETESVVQNTVPASDIQSHIDEIADDLESMIHSEISGITNYPALMGTGSASQTPNYLLLPLRGMLLLIIWAAALAAELYYIAERNRGVFIWLTGTRQTAVHLIYLIAAMIPVAMTAQVSLQIIGIAGAIGTEIPAMLLLILSFAGLTAILGSLIGGRNGHLARVAAAIPIIMILTIIFGGILLTPGILRSITGLFPTYYYMVGIQNPLKMWEIAVYAALTFSAVFLSKRVS